MGELSLGRGVSSINTAFILLYQTKPGPGCNYRLANYLYVEAVMITRCELPFLLALEH